MQRESPFAKATEELRAHANAELREFGVQEEAHPIMSDLYRRAKARLVAQRKNEKSKAAAAPPAVDLQRLVHELEVHQVELEMQNAELQSARNHLEALLERYTDLYDFAPVGCFTLSSDCVILLDHRGNEQLATRHLRVVKYRGSLHGTNEFPFLIGDEDINVLPITSLSLNHKISNERIATGIPASPRC